MKTIDEIVKEVMSYHGCTTGDCPHETQMDCYADLIKAGAESDRNEFIKRFPKGEEAAWRDCVVGDLKSLQERINMHAMASLIATITAIAAVAVNFIKG